MNAESQLDQNGDDRDPGSVAIDGVRTVDEIFEAGRRSVPKSNRVALWIRRTLLISSLLALYTVSVSFLIVGELVLARIFGAATFVLTLPFLVALGQYYRARSAQHRIHRAGKWPYSRLKGRVRTEAIELADDSMATTYQWSCFSHFCTSDTVAVLLDEFRRPIVILTKRQVHNEDDWLRLLTLLEDKLERL